MHVFLAEIRHLSLVSNPDLVHKFVYEPLDSDKVTVCHGVV
jgi:hypothetical protein